ncbi:cytolethal distending toxin subunit A [Bisgaardia hudsonensis]|uniref:Cytolethal distending toxin subunit A n=1 Tax=Bisgaardia hudsonensis TaxID=109472 RepID=A0A4R2N0H5_9PAST|nr:cytolethal distending toxin subunit A/C [Bisgaardia hudsonensis]QLB13480.1 hypothetical protein A6A11_07590 [Bisgaardia hudsonensis]TCP12889.1 cytolethal distending toxin subunit A [Bisgaardia hudsonensis]
MKYIRNYFILFFIILVSISCSSTSDNTPKKQPKISPTPPKLGLVGSTGATVTLPLLGSSDGNLQTDDPSNYITIMGQNGAVITVWALAKRNWLWGYAPIDSMSFGNIRNWKIERSFRREHFRFINQQLGTCIHAYGNGIIHDNCDPKNLDQDFLLLPTSNGAVFIKSVSQGRCITYNPVSTTDYTTITLDTCSDKNITPLKDQTWYLTPPLLPANPQTL